MTGHRQLLDSVIAAVPRACDPRVLVAGAFREGHAPSAPIRGAAIGKAALGMVKGVHDALGPHAWNGPIIVPRPCSPNDRSFVIEAGHPLPDEGSVTSAQAVISAFSAAEVSPHPRWLLLSGGASALMIDPPPEITLADYRAVVQALLRAGATIHELNTVRKHIDGVKGGSLAARSATAATIEALVISDVPGDDLSVIGSGPCTPDPSSFTDAWQVLERRACLDAAPAVTDFLHRGIRGLVPDTPKPGHACFARVRHRIIASNATAVAAVSETLQRAGRSISQVRRDVQGEAREVGVQLARVAWALRQSRDPIAIIWGGESTVTVRASGGAGGRNQELALAAAMELDRLAATSPCSSPITLLAFATDGADGIAPPGQPPATGAVVTTATVADACRLGLSASAALAANDSYGFFAALAAAMPEMQPHIRTGPTGTNVNDLAVALIN